jgi:DNA polymerase III alpha subunit
MIDFINLHHHDNFSLRCALGSVDDVIEKAKEFNQ